MAANPLRGSAAWNVFKVAGIPLPGIPTVTGCVAADKLDVKKGKGTKGSTVSYEGDDPKPFKVSLHLLTEQQYDEWIDGEARRILMTPPEGKTAKAFSVEHPKCQECRISSALKVSVSAANEVGDGSWKVEIELQPSSPAKASSGTPSGSKTKAEWQQAPAQSEADKTIDELTKQVNALAA